VVTKQQETYGLHGSPARTSRFLEIVMNWHQQHRYRLSRISELEAIQLLPQSSRKVVFDGGKIVQMLVVCGKAELGDSEGDRRDLAGKDQKRLHLVTVNPVKSKISSSLAVH